MSRPSLPSRSFSDGNEKPVTCTALEASEVLLTTDDPKVRLLETGVRLIPSSEGAMPPELVSRAMGPFGLASRFKVGVETPTAPATLLVTDARDLLPLVIFCSPYFVPSRFTGTTSITALFGDVMVDASRDVTTALTV